MPNSLPVLRVGLTGGIASGKTTVARIFGQLGAWVVDADALARAVLAPGGTAYEAVVERFGEGILDRLGHVDRPALARRVFGDVTARRALDAIVHPFIRAEAQSRIAECPAGPGPRIAVFDAALLVETGAYRDFDRIVVVHCSRETQLRRLMERDGLDRAQADARIDAQAPAQEKIVHADHLIETDGSLVQTRERARVVFEELIRHYRLEFGG